MLKSLATDLETFMHRLANESGKAILPLFRAGFALENKAAHGEFDPVTDADRAGEEQMRRLISQFWPEHGIIGEEFGTERADAEFRWVLDPIDGTRSFISGVPLWGTLIGLMREERPLLGMMSQPFTGERFWSDGTHAKYRGPLGERRLSVRRCDSLAKATLMTTSPRTFSGVELAAYEAVERRARLARYSADCYAYCMLASGQIDLVIENGLSAYDIVALIPIVEAAGGTISDWQGGSAANGGQVLAAGDRRVYEEAMDLLNSAPYQHREPAMEFAETS